MISCMNFETKHNIRTYGILKYEQLVNNLAIFSKNCVEFLELSLILWRIGLRGCACKLNHIKKLRAPHSVDGIHVPAGLHAARLHFNQVRQLAPSSLRFLEFSGEFGVFRENCELSNDDILRVVAFWNLKQNNVEWSVFGCKKKLNRSQLTPQSVRHSKIRNSLTSHEN